ncbi:MAG: type VI secretion system protein TssA [Rhizobiaceae bacterium]
MLDLAAWLRPLDGESPSGDDLRNDPRFHDLLRAIEPQVKVVFDDRNRPVSQTSTPTDWSAALAKAEELREQGRDLRLLLIVTRALAGQHGLAGLAQGVELVATSLDDFWDSIHPALRGGAPRDAALRRINALLDLQNGETGLLAEMRQLPFFQAPGLGPITGRDLEQGALDDRTMQQEAASGLNAAERTALSNAHQQLINRMRAGIAALADRSPDQFTALLEGGRRARAALAALDSTVNKRIGTVGPSVPELTRFLDRVITSLERSKVAGADKPEEAAMAAVATPYANGLEAAPAGASAGALPGRISSRDEVVKSLDLIISFYDRTEPSSPIPHLARRMRRMVHMDFLELMEDLAPSGLKEFRQLAGFSDKDGKKAAQKDER